MRRYNAALRFQGGRVEICSVNRAVKTEAELDVVAGELRLTLLNVNDLPRLWVQLEPLLERACEFSGGDFTPDIVLAGTGLHDGVERLQILALAHGETIESIMVTCVSRAPSGKQSLECLLTAGHDIAAWLPFEPLMDEWARSLDCTIVRIPRGRKGWLKALSHWRIGGYVLEREIGVT